MTLDPSLAASSPAFLTSWQPRTKPQYRPVQQTLYQTSHTVCVGSAPRPSASLPSLSLSQPPPLSAVSPSLPPAPSSLLSPASGISTSAPHIAQQRVIGSSLGSLPALCASSLPRLLSLAEAELRQSRTAQNTTSASSRWNSALCQQLKASTAREKCRWIVDSTRGVRKAPFLSPGDLPSLRRVIRALAAPSLHCVLTDTTR
eukprot:3583656-Rhodomonas_salina.1